MVVGTGWIVPESVSTLKIISATIVGNPKVPDIATRDSSLGFKGEEVDGSVTDYYLYRGGHGCL